MSRRAVLGLAVTTALMVLILLPAGAAAAGPWKVKDALGQQIGTVRTTSSTRAVVVHGGAGAGEVNRVRRGWWAAMGYLPAYNKAVYVWHAALFGGHPAWQLRGYQKATPRPLVGRIVKEDGRWVVQAGNSSAGWWTRGSVNGDCPPWAAGGAVLVLDKIGF